MIIKPQYNGPQFWDGGKTLDLYFSRDKALDSRVTFTRGSDARYFDASGVMQTASTDVARFDHGDFRTNLLTYSEDFSNAAWASSSANGVVTSNQVTAPDGTLTADKVAVASGQTTGDVRNSNTLSVGVTYALSVYAKAAEFTNVFLGGFPFGSGAPSVQINLLTGAVLENLGGLSVLVTDAGNNWWRIRISGGAYVAGPAFMYIGTAGTGNNTSGIYIWGAQLETGSTATSYIKTTSAAVTVGESLGLLVEGAGTNLLTYSEDFSNAAWNNESARTTISTNAVIAPDGTLTGDSLVPTTENNVHRIYNSSVAFGAGVASTVSAFVKYNGYNFSITDSGGRYAAWFNLLTGVATVTTSTDPITATMQDVGNGWYRCAATVTPTPGGNFPIFANYNGAFSFAGNGTSGIYIWGAQLETGTRATSYIKTVAATATRSADSASMTGTDFSQWFNAGEGTFVVEVASDYSTAAYSRGWMTAYDGALTNSINIYHSASSLALDFYNGGAPQVSFNPAYSTKAAMAYKANDAAASAGGSIATDSACAVPSGVNQMIIGSTYAGLAYPLNGHIKRLTYYPTRLTNGNLVELTNGTVR